MYIHTYVLTYIQSLARYARFFLSAQSNPPFFAYFETAEFET